MTRKNILGWLGALGLAGLINAFIFAWAPLLSRPDRPAPEDEKPREAVYLTHYAPPPQPEVSKPPKPPEPDEPPRQNLKKILRPSQQTPAPRADLKLTPLNFEINPRLSLNLAFSSPPRPHQNDVLRPARFEMGEVDQPPRVIHRVRPAYPFTARRRGLSGRVTVRFLVDVQGRVNHLTIVEASPPGVFEKSVRQAVAEWLFKPGLLKGRAVPTWVVLPIEFKLRG